MKRLLPWMLIPMALLTAKTLVTLANLVTPLNSVGVVTSMGDGTARVAALSGLSLTTIGGVPTLVANPGPASLPTIVVTHVQSTTANSFPIPAGKSVCTVTKNIPQSLTEDYTISNGAIVFNGAPAQDDIVQLVCW